MSGFSILNLDTARFECTFGRGCDGVCCRNGRPIVYPEESILLDAKLPAILPLLRPPAKALVEKHGFLSRRRKCGQPMARVSDGWCVFFNEGCVLHRIGAAEGDAFRFKPAACSLFPLSKDEHDRWYVRQKGYKGEIWDLSCLDPAASGAPAIESLSKEIEFAAHLAEPISEPASVSDRPAIFPGLSNSTARLHALSESQSGARVSALAEVRTPVRESAGSSRYPASATG